MTPPLPVRIISAAVLGTLPPLLLAITTDHPEDVVDLLTGTDTDGSFENYMLSTSRGNTLPQIKMPWGFNDWVPQTNASNGGFWFNPRDTTFEGLRCTHKPSPWIDDYGHLLLQPHLLDTPEKLKWSSKNSVFHPYFFSTTLEHKNSNRIGLELVPTSHAALLRITFPKTAKVGHLSLNIESGSISSANGTTIQGKTDTDAADGKPKDWPGMYFTVQAIAGTGAHASDVSYFLEERRGTLSFDPQRGEALVALATSFISQDQADENLRREVGSKSFDAILNEGRTKWSQLLKRVHIDAVDETQLAVFYTNLWKSMLFPRYLHEVSANGTELHRSPYTGQINEGKLVADSGFWDSYRTVYPLQSLVFADNTGSLIDGWVNAYKEASWLPEWPSPGEHCHMMSGTMGDVVLADAIAKSKWGLLRGFDVDKAYEAIRKDAFTVNNGCFGRVGLQDYIDKGYVPSNVPASVALTLDHYVADAAIARAAEIMGKRTDQDVLNARLERYPIVFNKRSHFFEPMDADGDFLASFDPLEWGRGFREASAWQYRFNLPFNVEGLTELYDGKLCEAIREMVEYKSEPAFNLGTAPFETPEMKALSRIQEDFGLYAHSNQPGHEILYIAKKAGCNDVADEYLRKVMQDLYTLDGWAGDEDNGEMASWYVLSALGVYQLEGAKDELVLGSPSIKHATVQLPNDKMLTIDVDDQSSDNVYVQSVTWSPKSGSPRSITDNALKITELMHGGKLTFRMGSTPKPPLRLRGTRRH